MKKLISVDIGSTYTKAALFSLEGGRLSIIRKCELPTTVKKLSIGYRKAIKNLVGAEKKVPVYFSSSAKGGLKIAAIGIVPDFTMKIAKLTALSAGGKVVKVFSYKLSKADLKQLEELNPDIILFTGGTDGGNEAYNIYNAKLLRKAKLSSVIIYAGNKAVAGEVKKILSTKETRVTENVLPEIDAPNPEPAREQIKEVFLKKIVVKKGLDEVVKLAGRNPNPTPYSVFELVKAISEVDPAWQDFCAIDMGGATTDFYSNHDDSVENPSVIYKGLREPRIKRTVEGDLGLRVNAKSVYELSAKMLEPFLLEKNLNPIDFRKYVEKIDRETDYLPKNEAEKEYDALLAYACVHFAAIRHAGTLEKVYTPEGAVYLQKGKDLRKVKKVIGTGGYLSRNLRKNSPMISAMVKNAATEANVLLPENPQYFIDKEYLVPLLGNLVFDYKNEAVKLCLENLAVA